MMNNSIKKLLIAIVLLVPLTIPFNTHAQTIAEFQKEVEKYTKALEEKENSLASNNQKISEIENKIRGIQTQIKAAQDEVKKLEIEIKKSNEEIKRKTEESKKLMEYYQISNGENSYLEYAFGATSITDLIYRMAVVEQLTDYNNQLMKELKELIRKNQERQKQLAVKQKELKSLQAQLEEQEEKLEIDNQRIRESMPSIRDQIRAAKANVSYYKRLGCGTNEDIVRCQYRIEQSSGGGSGSDSYGALVVKIKHNYNGKYIYSTYAHMRSFGNISKGQYVSPNTKIGNMGSTGYSTGPHLHLEITTCDWNPGGGCTWRKYQRSTINPFSLINIPSRWTNR